MTARGAAGIPVLVLASGSPRRTDILRSLGIPHVVDPADIDESAEPGELPAAHVARLAVEKAGAVRGRHPDGWILAGDTEVVLDGDSLGKPLNPAHARRMLTTLSGRTHVVLSSLALDRPGTPPEVEVEATRVRFRALDASEIEMYVQTGEPMGKAGAYAIQGRGAALVDRIEGDYSGVVGLPVPALMRLLIRTDAPWRIGSEPEQGEEEK